MAYDAYGNPVCTRDANGQITTVSYDGSATFPTTTTNPLGHRTTIQYYGVDGVPADTGLYGQVKRVTDPNRATATTQYDVFGRKTRLTTPDGAWTMYSYNQFGAGVGRQHVRTSTVAGLSTWTYVDGFGRPIAEKKTGADGQVLSTWTRYDGRGAVVAQSLPIFAGDVLAWTRMTYDAAGRPMQMLHPDGTRTLHCYDHWVSVSIDAKGHRRRETRDALGQVVRVDEYLGTFPTCMTDVGTPYATTRYQYDVVGNLVAVSDAKGNVTTMHYDTLRRKRMMQDPDMGRWQYDYDAAGNLVHQIDAKGQSITMTYDALHRLTTKYYASLRRTVTYRYRGKIGVGLE